MCVSPSRGFPDDSVVKNLPEVQETQEMQIPSLGQEDPLEKELATRSSVLAWEIHGQRSLVGYSLCGRKELDVTERAHTRILRLLQSQQGHLCSIKKLPSEESTVESVLNFRYRKAVLFFLLGMSFPVNVCKAPTNWGGFSSWKVFSFEKGGKLFKPA